MKLLTLQFLTCAVKTCKSKTMTAQFSSTTEQTSPFPLHPSGATLERASLPANPLFVLNIIPRIDWIALKITATEFGLVSLLPGGGEEGNAIWERVQDDEWRLKLLEQISGAEAVDESEEDGLQEDVDMDNAATTETGAGEITEEDEKILDNLHTLLLETEMMDGKLVCGSCGHEYGVKEGVGNFLLPAHLV